MIKKILLIILLIITTLSGIEPNDKYLDENKMNYISFRPFIGIDGGYAYLNTSSNANLDNSLYSYSIYTGIPISSYELMIKHKKRVTSDFDILSNSIVLNMVIDGSGTDMTYLGLVGGKGTLTWSDNKVNVLNISSKSEKDSFYGIHIGQKYKFARNFYGRIELEYMHYNFISTTITSEVSLDNTLEFIYGIEYRF